jgi:Leucine rich repeat
MAFLSEDPDGQATLQVTRLLRDHNTDNSALILSLVEGGGANRRILGYLFGLAVFHHRRDVSQQAMRMLGRHALPDTVRQAEKLKESAQYHYNEQEYFGRYKNPEFDLFDFVLAYKMCAWHAAGQQRGKYFEVAHQTLNLAQYAEPVLTSGFETLDFVRFLTLPAHKDFQIGASIEHMRMLPLESIHIENVRLAYFPVDLFSIKTLTALTIRRGTYRPRQPMQVPDGGPYGSQTLERLTIEGYQMTHEGRFGAMPQLREAHLVRCGLETIDFLSESSLLHRLDLRFNQLKHLPRFIGQMSGLQALDISHNPLESIELDLAALTNLRELDLKISRQL